jgi:hypothetical protein
MLEILRKCFFHKEKIIVSILEKLKDLVSALEDGGEKEVTEITEESEHPSPESPPSEEERDLEIEEELTLEEELEGFPDYLECSQEESDLIRSFPEKERLLKIKLAEKVLEVESVKQLISAEILKIRKEMLKSLNDLRLEYGVPQEGYSVQLPTSQSDKVSFIKD